MGRISKNRIEINKRSKKIKNKAIKNDNKKEKEKFNFYKRPSDKSQTTLSNKNKRIRRIVKSILKTESNCIDIGSNIGIITIMMAFKCSRGKILSIEPESDNFTLLEYNLKINKIGNVITKKCGVSDKNDEYFIYGNKKNRGDTRLSKLSKIGRKTPLEKIEVFTLDHITEKMDIKFDMVKIDVQGMDYQCMLGASNFLRKNPNCYFIIEFTASGSLPNTVVDPLYNSNNFCRFLFDNFSTIYSIDKKRIIHYKELRNFAKRGRNEMDLLCTNSEFKGKI